MIRKQSLAELEVIVPPLERQRAIVELADLAAEEQRLMARLADTRKLYIDGILMQAASGSQ
jgi:restriction endonuclease S subunit